MTAAKPVSRRGCGDTSVNEIDNVDQLGLVISREIEGVGRPTIGIDGA